MAEKAGGTVRAVKKLPCGAGWARLYGGEGGAVNGPPRKPGGTKSLFVSIKQSDIGSGLSVYDSNKKTGVGTPVFSV